MAKTESVANLFWRQDGDLETVASSDFDTEDELENYLKANPEVLGGLFILSNQPGANQGRDRPDLLAVDADGNVVVIEVKRGVATEDVVPQVLRYAIWAETNPDSLKALWLECESKPEELDINWDSLDVRVMVVAAGFTSQVLKLVNRIEYDTELVEVTRFRGSGRDFVLIRSRQPDEVQKHKPLAGRRDWGEATYRENHNGSSVDAFMKTVRWLQQTVSKRGWNLETKFNKNYMGFKYGFPLVFGVEWLSSLSFQLYFKLPPDGISQAELNKMPGIRYQGSWKQYVAKIDSGTDLSAFVPAMEAAYRHIARQEP
jgi:hypothetical protein